MTTYTDRQKACSDDVATIQTLMLDWINVKGGPEAKAVWNRIEDKLIAMEVKATLWDVVRSICIPHGAGVDKPVTEWLEERLSKPLESTSPITGFSEPARSSPDIEAAMKAHLGDKYCPPTGKPNYDWLSPTSADRADLEAEGEPDGVRMCPKATHWCRSNPLAK